MYDVSEEDIEEYKKIIRINSKARTAVKVACILTLKEIKKKIMSTGNPVRFSTCIAEEAINKLLNGDL